MAYRQVSVPMSGAPSKKITPTLAELHPLDQAEAYEAASIVLAVVFPDDAREGQKAALPAKPSSDRISLSDGAGGVVSVRAAGVPQIIRPLPQRLRDTAAIYGALLESVAAAGQGAIDPLRSSRGRIGDRAPLAFIELRERLERLRREIGSLDVALPRAGVSVPVVEVVEALITGVAVAEFLRSAGLSYTRADHGALKDALIMGLNRVADLIPDHTL